MERRLLARCRRGDREAFSMIVEWYRESVFGVAYRLTGCPETAHDLSQDTFVRVWDRLGQYDPDRPFKPWIMRIVRNLAVDHLRRVGKRREVSLDALTEAGKAPPGQPHPVAPSGDPRGNIYRDQIRGHLGRAMARLSPAHREVLMMFHEQEMSYQEIAETLGVPIGTVMSRLFNARRAMKREMEGMVSGEDLA